MHIMCAYNSLVYKVIIIMRNKLLIFEHSCYRIHFINYKYIMYKVQD